MFDMTIIALNVMNAIKRRLFEEDIEDVIGLDAESESVLYVFQRQLTDNVKVQYQVRALLLENEVVKKVSGKKEFKKNFRDQIF